MEINDLLIFKSVVNEGSISKAAQELGYVQPNVTERIKKLEQELGTNLLYRNSKGVSLLPAGEILLSYTDKILNLLEEAKQEIQMSDEWYRIGTTQTILSNDLSNRIKDNFNKFQIYVESSSQLEQLLKKQKVDMVIAYANYTNPAFHTVFHTNISVALQKAKNKTNIDYAKEFFFVSHDNQCPFRNRTIAFIEEQHLSKKQLQQVDSYSLIEQFVAQGNGLAFLPKMNEKLENIEDVQVETNPIYFYTNQASRKRIPSELNRFDL